jgi:heme/copper-type cytochrome/quinol oxidase subunit 3
MQRDVLEQQLSRAELQQLRNRRAGLTIFQMSWILVFICMVIVNLQLRWTHASWPPPGVEQPSPGLPTLATGLLLISALIARRATVAIKQDQIETFLTQWPLVIGLGAGFVAIMAFEWLRVPYTGIYSDVFRMMTAFHSVHALAVGAFMGMIYRGARAGLYGAANFWPVEGTAALWYFVIVAWILFYAVLYWI